MSTTIEPKQNHDKQTQLKSFDDTKSGVKGLYDSGITKVPSIFIQPPDHHLTTNTNHTQPNFPLIDLHNIHQNPNKLKDVINQVRVASERWGFFQVINHGIPHPVLQEMLDGVHKFYEQDADQKKKWYTRDQTKTIVYNSNFVLFTAPTPNWRDTFYCQMAPDLPEPQELPPQCSDIMIEFTKHVLRLGSTLFGILSQALGLEPNRLEEMKCADGLALLCHYYPICPQPELTLGTSKHTDGDFLTVLLNDQINGLQVLYENQWVDVPFVPGALVINIGDLLQLVSNDRFISAAHRVVTNSVNSRVSVACFFLLKSNCFYGPIDELISDDNPPKYRTTSVEEFVKHYNTKGLDGNSALLHFRI